MPRSPTSATRDSLKRRASACRLARPASRVGGVAFEHLHRHRAAVGGAQQTEHDLQLVGTTVPAVTVPRQFAMTPLQVTGRQIVEHQRAVTQMAAWRTSPRSPVGPCRADRALRKARPRRRRRDRAIAQRMRRRRRRWAGAPWPVSRPVRSPALNDHRLGQRRQRAAQPGCGRCSVRSAPACAPCRAPPPRGRAAGARDLEAAVASAAASPVPRPFSSAA